MRCVEVVIQRDRETGVEELIDLGVERVAREDADDDDEILQQMREERPWCDFELGIVEVR